MKGINNQAPVTCSKTITINTSSENVWAVLSNMEGWTAWQTDISKLKLNGKLKPGTSFDWKTGGANIHSTLHTVEPLRNLGWTGTALGTFAIHNWSLAEINGQTKVLVEESMEGFLVRLFRKAFNKSLEAGMQTWLDLLKQECEK